MTATTHPALSPLTALLVGLRAHVVCLFKGHTWRVWPIHCPVLTGAGGRVTGAAICTRCDDLEFRTEAP